jgi:hypothetical protein
MIITNREEEKQVSQQGKTMTTLTQLIEEGYCVTDEDDNYAVTGQCIGCGAGFIKGFMEGRTYDDECIGCGERKETQLAAFDDDQMRQGRIQNESGGWEIVGEEGL